MGKEPRLNCQGEYKNTESWLSDDKSFSSQNIMVWLTSENGIKSSKTAARTEMNLNAISSTIQILVSLLIINYNPPLQTLTRPAT